VASPNSVVAGSRWIGWRSLCEPGTANGFLAAVPDMHHVAILHDVVFAFQT
jgi:hypothetical protein